MKLPLAWAAILSFATSIHAAGQQRKLLKYLQPNDVEDKYNFATDPYNCTRECVQGDNRICYYQFNAENYATLTEACEDCIDNVESCHLPQCVTADGIDRGILTINRRLPGPSIQVCEGDRIIVDVINKMSGRSITIHWHGIFQRDTPYYDGVQMVTQCPILEDNTFRYDFNASQPGTFFWHSHNGIQKSDGLQGSLIIRRPKEEDPNGHLYDEDLPAHVVTVMDWFHSNSDEHFPGLTNPIPERYQTYFIINGRGRYKDPVTNTTNTVPYSEFRVTPGKRYRFRVIGATCDNCYVRLSIEGHRLTLIATDGNAVSPVDVDYVEISSGERYDFVLNATEEVKSYWIKVRAQGSPCDLFNNYQLAILKYEGSNQAEPLTQVEDRTDFNVPGVDLNPANSTCNGNGICVAELEAIEDFNPDVLNSQPNVTFTMQVGYYFYTLEELYRRNTYDRFIHPVGAVDLALHINNISYVEAPAPLLTQRDDIRAKDICPLDAEGFPFCNKAHCRCTQVLKVPLNALVQVILIDRSQAAGLNHPFHLHGFAFNVMAMGYLSDFDNNPDLIEELMRNNSLTKSPAPALKDTVTVPSRGYAVIRFIADNPGYWFFHCHFLYHHAGGMALTLQVGETSQHLSPPKRFPKCGNYLPHVDIDDDDDEDDDDDDDDDEDDEDDDEDGDDEDDDEDGDDEDDENNNTIRPN